MPGYRPGVHGLTFLAIALIAAALSSHGTSLGARQQTTVTPPVHSIKVPFSPSAPGSPTCELQVPSPEQAGVYRSDTVVWNFENGCATSITFTLREPRLIEPKGGSGRSLFVAGAPWPRTVSVPAYERRDLIVRVSEGAADDPEMLVYDYEVSVAVAGKPASKLGVIYFCRRTPCPPPWRKAEPR